MRHLQREVSRYRPPLSEKRLKNLAAEQGLKLSRSICGLRKRWVLRRADRWANLGVYLVYRTLAEVEEALTTRHDVRGQ